MKRLKAIAAVYMGIYLILPGCLCQILGAFGLNEGAARFVDSTEIAAAVSSDTPCHCHGISDKAVELAVAESGVPEVTFVSAGEVGTGIDLPAISPQTSQAFGRAPPDRSAIFSNGLRYFTGVFLI